MARPVHRPSCPAGARAGACLLALALLAGCASGPRGRDGAPADPPANLAHRPDAVPRIEPLRVGGPNKPYEVLGRRYVPMSSDAPLRETGGASWYGTKFHGQPTSLGERYDMYAMTAAHKTMPLPSYARVRNPANGREVIVRVNDRGPFAEGRVIDLSYTAALKLGLLRGVAPVEVERLTFDDIRSGRWRRDAEADLLAAAVGGAVPASAAAPVPALEDGLPGDGAPATLAGYWLQLGAFRSREGALELQRRVLADASSTLPAVAVFEDEGLFRVQAGPWPTRAQAEQVAQAQLRPRGLQSVVVARGVTPGVSLSR